MKRKKSLIILITVFVISYALIKLWKSLNPSQDMRNLRRIESILKVPRTAQRIEKDRGCYHDWKNARQYERGIYHAFRDLNIIKKIKQQIENSGWQLTGQQISDTSFHEELYWYKNTNEINKQIFIDIETGIENTFPYTLIISDTNSNQCIK